VTAQIIPVDPFDYIIFGGTGDLAKRKLLPALYHRDHDGQLPDEARLIGASRSKHSDNAYRKFAEEALREFVPDDQIDEETLKRFLARLHYLSLDVTDDEGWDELKKLLGDEDRIRAFYLAVGPNLFGPISEALEKHGLTDKRSRLVIEKPLGRDLESAQELNREVGAHFDEEQVFRIDHYLGKETVQNLLALRFANALFEPLWNNAHIDHVQITVAETVGVGDRAGYYDKAGAVRDMVQNHLMQLLCLVAMEPPANGDADSIRDEKLKVLRSLTPIDADNVGANTGGNPRDGADEEGRVAPRFSLLIRAAKIVSSHGEFVCVVRDVSETGVAVRLFHGVPTGDPLELHMPGGGVYEMRTIWERENEAGFEFVEPIDVERIIHEIGEFPKRGLRLGLYFPITIKTLTGSCEAVVENVSQQGARFETDETFAIDQNLRIACDEGGLALKDLRAKVRWRKGNSYGVVFDDTMTLSDFARFAARLQCPKLLD